MAGLNHIREAYEQVYAQLDERMDDDAREMRRLAAAERRAGNSDRMDPKVAAKYASSEAQSAARADKKSRGKHIHGMADSYEVEGELVDEKFVKAQNPSTGRKSLPDRQSYKGTETEPFRGSDSRSLRHEIARSSGTSKKPKNEGRDYLGRDHGGSEEEHQSNVRFGKRMAELQGSITSQGKSKEKTSKKKLKEAVYGGEKKEPKDTRMTVTAADQKGNTPAWKRYQAGHPGYKAAPHLTKEEMIAHLQERALDYAEKREKKSVFKAIKPSKLAKTYPEKSPEELERLRYAISTAQAKKNMDTSRSDKRYGTEA